jgi:hypothetical protein
MIYALNTDGIDVAGEDITVRNCTVTNFDDTVCAKPQLGCTRNLLVEDITIFWGCGLSMGSVPPDVGNNCISGALVRRVAFNSPLKAVYIKPNPAKAAGATGEISNITYQDLTVNEPVWWPIWLGTQQQHQVRAAPGVAGSHPPSHRPRTRPRALIVAPTPALAPALAPAIALTRSALPRRFPRSLATTERVAASFTRSITPPARRTLRSPSLTSRSSAST